MSFLHVNRHGKQLESHQVSIDGKKTTPEAICTYIAREVRRILHTQKMKQEQLLVLVVGVPAIANVDEGVVLSISTLDRWRSVPLRAMLNKIFDCLIIVENDTNLAALAERYCGAAQHVEDFILISIREGTGPGSVL